MPPRMVVVVLSTFGSAPQSTGLFWRVFGPLSGSPTSLAVTPSLPRSMPRVPLSWMLLPRMLLPKVVSPSTRIPACPLPTTRLPSPGFVPPMVLSVAPFVMAIPEAVLPLWMPVASVPKKLHWMVALLAPSRKSASVKWYSAKPRTVLAFARSVSPLAALPAALPSSSILSVGGHAAQLAPGCVLPSSVTGAVIAGRGVVGTIRCTSVPGRLKRIARGALAALAS